MEHGKNRGDGGDLEGRYANYFEIGHNAFEFLFDFGQLYSEEPEAKIHTRIITSPFYAKALIGVLTRAISQYEQSHGRVTDEIDAETVRTPPTTQPRILKTI